MTLNLTLILAGITALFFILLFIKSFTKKKFCVICVSVSLTWITLLILYFLNIFTDKLIIGILMGGTSVGLFYMLYEKIGIFKLPFLLTLISMIYFILGGFVISTLYLIAGLWILFFIFNLFQNKTFFKNIVECCKKW